MNLYCKNNGDGTFGNPQGQPRKITLNHLNLVRSRAPQGTFSEQDMLDAGYLPYVAPEYDANVDKLGELIIGTEGDSVTHTVVARSAEEIAGDLAMNIEQIDQACRAHIDRAAHWTSSTMVSDKAKAGKPKATAVEAWANECWNLFYTREAQLEGGMPFSDDMLVFPDCPHSMKDVMQEV